jgi:predicted kinase
MFDGRIRRLDHARDKARRRCMTIEADGGNRSSREQLGEVTLVYGYLGSGKTTYSRRLADAESALLICTDEWMVRIYGDNPPSEGLAQARERVRSLLLDLVGDIVLKGVSVVFDDGFWERPFRDRVRERMKSLGATPRLVSVVCEEAEAWKRVELRNRSLDGKTYLIERNTFEVLKTLMDPLGEDEPHEIVRSEHASRTMP